MTSISEKYASRKISMKLIVGFLSDIYHSGKITELVSFAFWELKYQLRFYKAHEFVNFLDDTPLHTVVAIDKISIKNDSFCTVNCKYNWVKICLSNSNIFFGSTYNNPSVLLRSLNGSSPEKCFEFSNRIESIFIDKLDNLFVCSGGILFKSKANKINFKKVLKFSTPTSYFRPESITENLKGDLFIGEYANNKDGKKWVFVGFIYHSIDNGNTWSKTDFLSKEGINKHIHILKWSKRLKALIMTEGDNKKGIWVNKSFNRFNTPSQNPNLGWRKVNSRHIDKGGYTAIIEVNEKIIFGTDYYGGTNFLVSTTDLKLFNSKVMPDPYRRSMISRMVIRRDKNGTKEIWANLYFRDSKSVKSLLMLSIDCGSTWQRVIEYDATQYEVDIISDSINFKNNVYISIQDREKKFAKTFCITNTEENSKY